MKRITTSSNGQGAAEYLITLGVVLAIAIAAIGLLGGLPGFGADAKISQSDSYWKGARPFGIVASSQTGSTLTLVLQNNMPERYVISGISVGSLNASAGYAADATGNSNGILGNGAAAQFPTVNSNGKVANAYRFDGSNDIIYMNNVSVDLSAGAKNTVDFWMNYSNGAGIQGFQTPVTLGYVIGVYSNCIGFNTGNGEVLGVSIVPYLNKWTHVTTIFFNGQVNATNNEIYINGVKQSIYPCAGGSSLIRNVSTNLRVGAASQTGPWVYNFNGSIDEVAVYSRALTASEVLAINNSNVYPADGLVGRWGFDENINAIGGMSSGEKRSIVLGMLSCASGSIYEYQVNITYFTENLGGFKEFGAKPLVGKCS